MREGFATRWIAVVALTLIGLVVLYTRQPLQAGDAKKSDAVVKVEAKADKPDGEGKQVVTVTLTVDKDWHLYANPVGNDDLAPSQTTLEITAKVKPRDVKIEYPKGKLVKDATAGDYMVYEDKVVIKATVLRAKDDTGTLELSVKLQACSDVKKTCLLPATLKVSVP
jgi:hypothetical protein